MSVKCLCWNCGREIPDNEPIHEINEELWCEKCANPHEMTIPWTMMKNPCKDCPNRYPGCHSKCDKYIAWKKEWDELKEKERLYNKQRKYRRNTNGTF